MNNIKMKHLFFLILILCFSLISGFSQQKQETKNMNKALIIIDIQNDYFENGKMPLVGSVEASLNARQILDKFRSENLQIIHIQHIANRPGTTFFVAKTHGMEIHENVKANEVHNSFLAALNGFYAVVKTTKQYMEEK